jgi:hypothetical integral membrane protein (TIGR02206 family)
VLLLATEREFTAYGPSHWLVLLTFAAGAAALVAVGRRQRGAPAQLRLCRALAVLTLAMYAAIFLYSLIPPSIDRSVPLQLSDLAAMVTAYALWSRRHWAFALTYYWGLLLTTQALMFPAHTGPDFPHYGFLAFWGIHLLVVWAAIYLTWGVGMRPDWRSYRIVVGVTVAWAAFTFTFNLLAGTNYGFLNSKPRTASLLDVLGPWPWYLLPVAALVLGTWAAMTWPWTRRAPARAAA